MSGRELISSLPEPILHHCLSFLPTKYAIHTSVLSKKWKSIWDSFPILNFDQSEFDVSQIAVPLSLLERKELFLNYLNDSIERRDQRSKIQKLRLVMHFLGSKSDNRITRAIDFAVEGDVRDLELAIFTPNIFEPPCSLYKAKFLSVVKLKKMQVEIDDLMQGCPLIEELRVQDCRISREIKVVSHKLTTLEINNCTDIESLTVEGINLQLLIFSGGFKQCYLSISACTLVKQLSLSNTLIRYQWLEDVISKLVSLETLDLRYCYGLNRVRVHHQELRSFTLCVYDGIKIADIKVDCPRLRWFMFKGMPTRYSLFNSCGIIDVMLWLNKPDDIEISHWFANLIGFLQLFGHSRELKLKVSSPKDLLITEECKDRLLPPLYDLKNLIIETLCKDSVNYAEVVDSVLWLSPHLERLSIISGGDNQISVKFQSERANEEIFCCMEYPKECWKHFLKKVTVTFYNGSDNDKEDLFDYFRKSAKALLELVEEE